MAKTADNQKLNPRQRQFVFEYLVDFNATEAAIRAGYSVKTARQIASQNLSKLNIQRAIREAMNERAERTKVTADRVLLEYARIGFSDIRDYVSWDEKGKVSFKDSSGLSEDAAAAILEVSESITENGRTRKFKLHSKTAALSDMAKHLGLFEKDNRISVEVRTPAERIQAFEEWRRSQGRPPLRSIEGGKAS